MSKLAACIIVEGDNRAPELRNLLANLRPHVDAIFLTVNNKPHAEITKLAVEFECELSYLPWKRNFAEQRNFNFKQAHKAGYEFLFWADTDDLVDKPQNLRKLVAKWPENLDLYLALYEYAREFDYRAVTHWRERLIKFDPTRMKWVGRVHEQLICEEPSYGERTDKFAVIHQSKTEIEDASLETSSRNLEILLEELASQGNEPDPRTLIQLGRTYMGMGDYEKYNDRDGREYWQQALPYLEQYIPLSGWDEERYEAIYLLGRCMEQLGNLELAEKFYYRAVMELFDRKPAYEGLIRVYFQKSDWKRVIFWFETMSRVIPPETNHLNQEITSNLVSTGFYVKALFLTGQFRQAWEVWKKLKKAYGRHPAIAEDTPIIERAYHEALALEGITSLAGYFQQYDKSRIEKFFEALPRDFRHHEVVADLRRMTLKPRKHASNEVTIFCGPIGLEEWAYPSIQQGIGGSEEAVINMAEELNKLGWKVTVYNNCGKLAADYNGVNYVPFYEVNPNDEFNVYIGWRELGLMQGAKAKVKWLWLHDVPNPEAFTERTLKFVDKILVLSEYHRSLLPNVPDEKVYVTRNGVDLRFFNQEVTRNPKLVVYTSSPERGLVDFLKIAEEVKKQVPDAQFEAYYGWQNNDAVRSEDPEYQEWKAMINAKMKELGMLEYVRLSHRKIAAKMLEAAIWLYPTNFPEISCIAAMKAQIAGAIPVTTGFAALAETVQFGDIFPLKDGAVEVKPIVKDVVRLLKDERGQEEVRTGMMSWAKEKFPWSSLAAEWSEKWGKK